MELCLTASIFISPAGRRRPIRSGMEALWTMRCWPAARPPLRLLRGGGTFSRRSSVSIHGGLTRKRAYDGLLVDAGGTLLQFSRPVEETYASIGRKYGEVFIIFPRNLLKKYFFFYEFVVIFHE